jgi:hypothetical protein
MDQAKTYLNVPYAEKDAAKALGARWDPAYKKWYIPTGKDIALFAQWKIDSALQEDSKTTSVKRAPPSSSSSNSPGTGVFTYPTSSDFVAYCGDEAPWD